MRFGRKSLSGQLLTSVLGIYVLITFVVTMIHIFTEYKYTKENVKSELGRIAHIFEPALRTALWNLNDEQLVSIGSGMQEMPLVYSIVILDANDKMLYKTKDDAKNHAVSGELTYAFSIHQTIDNKSILLAKVTLSSSEEAIFDRLKVGLVMLFLNAFIKSTTLVMLFYLAFRKHLELPLKELTRQITSIKEKEDNSRLIDVKFEKNNELSSLQVKFNDLLSHIYAQEKEQVRIVQNQNKLLEALVKVRTAALEHANKKLIELSTTDEMTSLANRRNFNETMLREWAYASRNNKPLSLIMLDVDSFKKYNDRYGHLAGDECLKRVAEVIKTNARRTGDLAARYGGEEFILLLPEANEEYAKEVAEHIRKSTEELGIEHELSEFKKVTVSIGVATLIPDGNTQNIDNFVHLADSALYEAKAGGKNRIVIS